MNVLNLCRSCMKEMSTDKNKFNLDTVSMFTFCTNIRIRSEEKLPNQFCNQCTSAIHSCYNFVKRSREADLKLRDMIAVQPRPKLKPETGENSKFENPDIKPEDISESDDNNELVDDYMAIKIEPELPPQITNASKELIPNSNKEKRRNEKKRRKEAKSKTSDIADNIDWSLVNEFKTYICTTCSKGFVRKKNYECHMLTHHSEGISPVTTNDVKTSTRLIESVLTKPEDLAPHEYPCPHCSEKFESTKERMQHKRLKHRGQLQFICDYCNKVFKVKGSLKLHLHMHDDSLKPHLCDFCGSRFSHRHKMLDHQLVHTGQKPFTCELCGYTCRQASNIRRHKRAHLNERKHQCVQCGKGFNELVQLKKHMYMHTGERPYKCPHCDNSYKSSGKRKNHLVRAHGLDPSEVPRLAKDGGPARRYVTEDSTPRNQYTSLVADAVNKFLAGNNIEAHPTI